MFNPWRCDDPRKKYDPFAHLETEELKRKAKKLVEEEERRREEGPCRPACWR